MNTTKKNNSAALAAFEQAFRKSCFQFLTLITALTGLGLGGLVCGQQAPATAEDDYAPGELLIKFRTAASDEHLRDAWLRPGLSLIKWIKFNNPHHPGLIHASTRIEVLAALRMLAHHPAVEYAEPNYKIYPAAIPNDPQFSGQWGLHNTGGSGGKADADIDAPEAWNINTGNPNLLIGVVDTGIDINHPDLAPNVWTNPGETGLDANGHDKATNGIDDDGNGYVDDVNGWDFWNHNNSVYDRADGDAHGTHVAGTIAAAGNNGIGVVGVNWRAKIVPLKFIGPQFGYFSGAGEAINYAAAKGVKVLNGSFGRYSSGPGDVGQGLKDVIEGAGILFVAAAGNEANNTDQKPFYPASYNSALVISVAATDRKDQLASFSNYGAVSVDLGAPGVNIVSTLPGGSYGAMSGTSMAAPHVSGVAGLVYSQFPNLTAAEVKSRILLRTDPASALKGKTATGGRLNAFKAVAN